MYKPKLIYAFCLMRKRSLMPALSVMRYMNSVGLIPQLLINDTKFNAKGKLVEDQLPLIVEELNRYRINYTKVNDPSGCDVMFSEGVGAFCSFEKKKLIDSKGLGKTNVVLVNSLSGWRNQLNPYFRPGLTRLIDGICMKVEEHLLNFKEFTKKLFLVNVGDPDWDWWQSDEFTNEVKKVNSRFGDKIFVFGDVFIEPASSIPYVESCIAISKKLGFKFMINPHPDRWDMIPKQFYKYCNREIHHHVLFKAASHVVGHVSSSIILESMLLGTRAGTDPTVAHCDGQGKHRWLDRDSFRTKIAKHLKQEIIDMVPLVFDEEDIHNFLSSFEPNAPVEVVGKAFGKIDVPCYSEYLFKTLDKKLMVRE